MNYKIPSGDAIMLDFMLIEWDETFEEEMNALGKGINYYVHRVNFVG